MAKPAFKLERSFSLFAGYAALAVAWFILYVGQLLIGVMGQGAEPLDKREVPVSRAEVVELPIVDC